MPFRRAIVGLQANLKGDSMAQTEVKTPETAALVKFVEPAEQGLDALGSAIVRNPEGEITRIDIRSDRQYEAAGVALAKGRKSRTAFESFWKEDPGKPQSECMPGEGHGYFMRRAWEGANSIFNHFDQRLRLVFGPAKEGGLIDKGMADYRAEVERKAREKAERTLLADTVDDIAAAIRQAESDGKEKLAAELRVFIKGVDAAQVPNPMQMTRQLRADFADAQRRQADRETEAQRKTDLAAAKSKREKEDAERRAKEAKEQAARDAEQKQREAENVQPVVERSAPVSSGATVRRVWKARLAPGSDSLQRLIHAVANGTCPARVLELNERAANDLASAFGGQNPPDGMEFYQEEVTSSRAVRR
jgi:hypothetical protein